MNLSEKVKTDPQGDKGVRVPWDEDGKVGFILKYTGRNMLTDVREKTLKRKYDHKTKRIEEAPDNKKFNQEILKEIVLGWWGLKGKHLYEILDPSVSIDVPDEQDIDFTPENRDVILENYNLTFDNFITSVAMDINVYRQYKNEQLEKNLKTSQPGVGVKA